MKLKFNQRQYQTDAANAIVDIFEGQSKSVRKEIVSREQMFVEEVFSNPKIQLTEQEILKNTQKVQKRNGLKPSIEIFDMNFTVEMETGTGKTYVYTKTMYELNKKYGWNKFIIMVPSIAIREGVKKSLENTAEHFYELYGQKIRSFIYNTSNKSNLVNIKNFATTKNIEVIIMNYQAFGTRSEADRKIYQKLDKLQSRKPIEVIKRTRPILIIDEPQKFGAVAEKKMKKFNSLFKLRYSATHKKDYNKVYRLDAIDAFNKKLVKKIKVKGIQLLGNTGTNSYLYFDRIRISTDSYPIAYLELEIKQKNGIKKKIRKVSEKDDLFSMSNEFEQYKGYVVKEINGKTNKISFTNGIELEVGQAQGDVDEKHIRRVQIRETINSHLEKEKKMFDKGIKVLSLFFIDEVAKYRQYDDAGNEIKGEYQKIFEEEYQKAVSERDLFNSEYNKYLDSLEVGETHKAYFSIDNKGRFRNSKSGDAGYDVPTYELIMKDKERLLSFEEPCRFIFSHSALREGWDNPNVFQICTLKHSESTMSKRQEIGRGLRISVDDDGNRMDYPTLEDNYFNINTLTVIASESYDDFARELQKEILKTLSDRPIELLPEVLENRILNNSNGEELKFSKKSAWKLIQYLQEQRYLNDDFQVTDKLVEHIEKNDFEVPENLKEFESEIANLLKGVYDTANYQATENEKAENIHETNLQPNENFAKQEFQDLWKKIKVKTIYKVDFDSQELIKNSIEAINNNLEVRKIYIQTVTGEQKEELDENMLRDSGGMERKYNKTQQTDSILGAIKYDLVGEIVKGAQITRKTTVSILKGLTPKTFSQFQINPEDFIQKVIRLINEQKATTLINNITYSKLDQTYDNDIFTINNLNGSLQENILEVKKHIYDYVKTDSKKERKFAKSLEEGEVAVYAKLPSGFKIPTPVGNYNPDWAIVFDKEDVKYIYFIAETKGSMSSMSLRKDEELRINYARKHFQALNHADMKYDVVIDYKDLINKIL